MVPQADLASGDNGGHDCPIGFVNETGYGVEDIVEDEVGHRHLGPGNPVPGPGAIPLEAGDGSGHRDLLAVGRRLPPRLLQRRGVGADHRPERPQPGAPARGGEFHALVHLSLGRHSGEKLHVHRSTVHLRGLYCVELLAASRPGAVLHARGDRLDGGARDRPALSGPEEGQHRQHAPVVLRRGREVQLAEDARHVLLDGPLGSRSCARRSRHSSGPRPSARAPRARAG